METKDSLYVFETPDMSTLRVGNYHGEYWFCARDLCSLLGIQRVGKALLRIEGTIKTVQIEARNGVRDMAFIDLYAVNHLLFQTQEELARETRAWFYSAIYPVLFTKADS